MGTPHRVATCCYCGSKTALVLSGRVQHQLVCGACGAPLRDMKNFPKPDRARQRSAGPPRAVLEDVWSSASSRSEPPRKPKKRRKKRKTLGRKLASELFDLIEDIID